ncbi:MAG: hypothetical protein ACLSVD_07645 [Eggerthellaceae bacterium]
MTPETLVSCFTVNDLGGQRHHPQQLPDDEDAPEAVGWYCIEKSFFGRDNVEALLDNNASPDGHLDIVLQILLISPEEVAQGMPSLDELGSSTSWRSSKASRSASTTATCSRRCPFVPPRGRRAVRLGARRRRGFRYGSTHRGRARL